MELFIASDKSFEQFKLVEEDWEDLTIILKILKPLEEATRYLSASKYPTIISSMRTYDGLMIQVGKAARTYKGGSVAVEAQRYFQEAVIDGKEKPQMFWKSKEKIFSTLAAMARDVLAVPATSTSSERAFSRGKLIIDQSRSCFSPEKFVR